MTPDPLLDPVALDGSPAQAFASHSARTIGIAKYFANTRPLSTVKGQANEDNTTTLLAHFHCVAHDPTFQPEGAPRSDAAAPAALRRLDMGNGLVGTHGASTKRDYDMGLKGLVILAYRYPDLLDKGIDGPDAVNGVDFILDTLVPANISGGHPPEIEIVEQSFLNIDTPETENHLLMIESSRYLFNQLRLHRQLRLGRDGDPKFDNRRNGLSTWLVGYMQRIAKHDFLEFNSSPYQRLALHALLNLHEFARAEDEEIRTAAQILLDYTMMKCALSSNRGRRVSPFRRQQHRIAHQANWHNYLYVDSGDQVSGFLLGYTGLTGADKNGTPVRLPPSQVFNELLAATAAYRPPPAAYILALNRNNRPSLHRFFHGKRPPLPSSRDDAEGGLEIYYHSPSFLLSAGGQFLNSGYGHDEIDIGKKKAWEQTSRAQATTLIPTQADPFFHDLVRFESYPDPQVDPYADDAGDPHCYHTVGVNIGVSRGLMAGANLRPAEKKTVLENSTSTSPAFALHKGGMFMAWKGSGNDNINVARVQGTILFGIDGVEGVEGKVVLGETTDRAPAIVSNDGRLFLAWRGSGNNQLNLAFSEDDGRTFKGKTTLGDSSEHAPALASHNGRVYLAWTGRGNDKLNVARVILLGNTAGGSGFELERKVVLGDTSSTSPAIASQNGRLFIAWKGSGNDNLNLMFSQDDGATFRGKAAFGDSSSHAPALASHSGRLFMAWKGSGNENLNVARVVLIGNTAGAFGIEGLEAKAVLGEISTQPPALGSWNGLLFLGWKGEGEDLLNLRVSRDGSFRTQGPWFFSDLTPMGFYLAAYRAPASRPQDLDPPPDNLGLVYAVEKSEMDARGIDFNRFRELTLARNGHLPATLDYGGTYEFHGPDDRNFSIWFKLTGDKYRARVIDLDDPLTDLTTLPLVSGEFMRAPGDHDGLIEIRHPGCETPLVLDFRNPDNPVRGDNMKACPEPWLDRAQALLAFAQKLSDAGKPKEAQAALNDRVEIYKQLGITKFPIAIDATRLFLRYFLIPGVVDSLTDARRVQAVQFAPGDYNYQFQSGLSADFKFTITPQGTVDYDHSCDLFLSGRGTATLQLQGLEVTLDALSLTGADNGGGVFLASVGATNEDWIQRRTVRLLPHKSYWVQQGSGRVARLEFALQRDGRFSYRPELETAQGGCLAGAGTTTLTFKGHTVSVDASAVSHLLLIQPIWGAKPAQNGKTTVVVLPADGFTLQLDQGMTDLVFSVGATGTVTVDPAMTGRLEVVPASPPIVRVLPH
jgi:hypothetical protein